MHKPNLYFPNLHGLRFFAALSVIVYHIYGEKVLYGHIGVILFFVLSGFLITSLLFAERDTAGGINIKYFFVRRCLRIWPLYFLIVGISIFFILIHFKGYNIAEYTGVLWYYLLIIPNVAFVLNVDLPFAGILWSVGSEEQFYLLWPFLFRYTGRFFGLALIIIIGVFVSAPILIDHVDLHSFHGQNAILYFISHFILRLSFNCMATGALTAYLWRAYPGIFRYIFPKVVQVMVILLIIYLWLWHHSFTASDQVFSILFALLIANFALNPAPIVSLENAAFKQMGKISYGLYVYHPIVLTLTGWAGLHLIGRDMNKHLLFIVGTLLTIGVATLSYDYFEKFFLKIKDIKFTVIKSGLKL